MTHDCTLSVLTLTCNRLGKVRAMLELLLPQLEGGDEVVLLDTGSTDGTREYFQSWTHPRVRFLTHDGPGGWAELRNRLAREARGELAAFLDDDCLPAPDWVARGKAALLDRDGGADAVGGVAQPYGIEAFPAWWHPEMGWMVGLSVPGHAGPEAGVVHYPMTSNLWTRTAAPRLTPFQEIGGRLGGEARERYAGGREDAEWWRRLRVEGYRVRFDPELVVRHAIDPSRISLAYLGHRARLDGAAWARREGTRADTAPLAYQWWRQWLAAWAAIFEPPATRAAHWHYHRLTAQRHGTALKGLAARFAAGGVRAPRLALVPSVAWAGARLAWDQAKGHVRRSARPWLVSRPLQPTAREVTRLAVMAFANVGDLVILQAALRGLMKRHPRVEIYVMAPPAATVALGGVPRMNVTITPANPKATQPRGATRWMEDWLARLDPDAIVAPYLHGPWGAALARMARPPRPIVGFDHDQGLVRRWMLERLSVRVHKRLDLHELDNLGALLGAVGLACEPEPAVIQVPSSEFRVPSLEQQNLQLETRNSELETGRAWIMFNPDAGHAQKEWTDEGWAELARRILDETECRVVINAHRPRPQLEESIARAAGPIAADGAPVAAALGRPTAGGTSALPASPRVHWLREAPLEELVAWLARCRALVTVDAGPQHLAHALGVPSVTLYGPMDERRWRDRWARPIHRIVRACAFDLTPQERRGLAENHMVARIKPCHVWAELDTLLKSTAAVAAGRG